MININQIYKGYFLLHINFLVSSSMDLKCTFICRWSVTIKQISGFSSCMFNTLSFIHTNYSFTTIRPDFMDPSYFVYLSFIIPPQWSNSFINKTIQPKYMVLFHLFCFLVCTTIRLKIRVLIINLFQLYAHDISTKTYDPLSFVFFFSRVLNNQFLSFAHDCSTVIYGLFSFKLSFLHDRSTKN